MVETWTSNRAKFEGFSEEINKLKRPIFVNGSFFFDDRDVRIFEIEALQTAHGLVQFECLSIGEQRHKSAHHHQSFVEIVGNFSIFFGH